MPKTINQLNPAASVVLTDNFATQNTSNETKRATGQQVVDLASANVQISEAQVTGLTAALAAKQPLDANLTNLAALTPTAKNTIIGDGSDWLSQVPFSPQNVVYVAKNGSNVTGTGSFDNPYADPGFATTQVTGTSTNRYLIYTMSGYYDNFDLVIKPWVSYYFEPGTAVVTLTDVTVDPSWDGQAAQCVIENWKSEASTGFNLDFSSFTGTGGMFQIVNCLIQGPFNMISNEFNTLSVFPLFNFMQGETTFTNVPIYVSRGNIYLQDFNIVNTVQPQIVASCLFEFFVADINLTASAGQIIQFNPRGGAILGNINKTGVNSDIQINADAITYKEPTSGTADTTSISQGVLANITATSYTPTSNRVSGHLEGINNALLTTEEITGTSHQMVVNRRYIINNAALCTLTLPLTFAYGDVIEIIGKGAGGWLVAQNAGQNIRHLSSVSTTGVGGSVDGTTAFACITLNTIDPDVTMDIHPLTGALNFV